MVKTGVLWHRSSSFNSRDTYTRAISRVFSVMHEITFLLAVKINNFFLFGVAFATMFYRLNLSSIHRQAKASLNPVHPFCKQKTF